MSGVTQDDVRRIALAMPEVEESAHFGKSDFRVRGKVLVTFPEEGVSVVKLTPDQQSMLLETAGGQVEPVKGSWGAKGWTRLLLSECDTGRIESAVEMAWRNVAPKRLIASYEAGS